MSHPPRPLVALVRRPLVEAEDLRAIEKHFELRESVVGVTDRTVVGRMSVVPFYNEVERDLKLQGSELIHDYRTHQWIASMAYVQALGSLTPRTYFSLSDVPKSGGPFVVKGATTSRKWQWATHMFAPTYLDAARIASELQSDTWIGDQPIVVRDYVPLKVLETGINGLPFANEWRCFFYGERFLAAGYYWSCAEARGTLAAEGLKLAHEAAGKLASALYPVTPFVAIDVAETASGEWTVIEVNDGQQAGLSEADPETLWSALSHELRIRRQF